MANEHPLWAHLRDQHNHMTDGLTDADVPRWQQRHDVKLHAPTSHVPVPHNHVEQEVDTRTYLPLGCIFDSHMGWHNTYRIVDLAVANGMVIDKADAEVMEAYENQAETLVDGDEVHDSATIAEFATEISDKALEFLNDHCTAPFQYVEWDDGDLMCRQSSAEDIYGHQGWTDSTLLALAIRFIDDDYTGERRAAFDSFCRDAALAENATEET